MQTLIEDIQFAWRSFLKTPKVCALIILTLSLGIGANAAIFSMVYNVVLAPLPFEDGDRIFKLQTNYPNINRYDVTVSVPTAMDYINNNTTLERAVEYHQMAFTLLGHGDPSNVEAGIVSWDFFEMFKVRPLHGRTFLPGEDEQGAAPLIILSYDFWMQKFGGDPAIVGQNLEMNSAVHQVIGVLPKLPAYPFNNDIWVSSSSCPGRGSDMFIGKRERPISNMYGKVKSGLSFQQASTDINTLSQQLEAEYPDIYGPYQGVENHLLPIREDMNGDSHQTFYLLLGITLLVLLIACANVANLNLARMADRNQELAIREALGANPGRIARQLLTESVMLAIVGGCFGLLFAYVAMDMLASFTALFTPLASEVEINTGVLSFCLLVSVLTGILSGIVAIFQKRNINTALKEGSGNITASSGNKRLRQTLLIAQFSLSFIILSSASLVSLSLYRLNQQDVGFNTQDIVIVGLSKSGQDRRQFVQETSSRLKAHPEINDVAFSSLIPMARGMHNKPFFQIEGKPPVSNSQRPEALTMAVSANYHQMLEIPLLSGRYLQDADDENNPGSIVINQKFAEQFFANENPVGQRISMNEGKSWRTIRGVVGNIREQGIDKAPEATFYKPFLEGWQYELRLLIDSKISAAELREQVSKTVHQVNPRQPVNYIRTLQLIKEDTLSSSKLISSLVSLFAFLAFLITLSGVIGVVAYNVSQRRKEIGIRLALGANPKDIRKLFIIQGLSLSTTGLVLGVLIMIFVSPFLRGVLFATEPLNPPLYLVTVLVITLIAAIAIMLPTQKVTQINPNQALREQ